MSATINFSSLQQNTTGSNTEQFLIRLDNSLSGADGFARITKLNMEQSLGVYTTVQSNSAAWAADSVTDTGVRSLTSNWQNTYTTVQSNSSTWGSGTSLPTGGATNQVLVKNSATNNDVSWKNKRTTLTLATASGASATISCNALSADQFVVALSGVALSATFAAPICAYDAQIIMWNVRYTTNVARIILASDFRAPATTLNWSISANKMDIFAAKYNQLDSKWDVISFAPGYSI